MSRCEAIDAQAFWAWACDHYQKPAVSKACLSLQDEAGQCVPYLLWLSYCYHVGAYPSIEVRQKARDLSRLWHDEVISPLRALRRALKTNPAISEEQRDHMRAPVKDAELEAEKKLMHALSLLKAVSCPPDMSLQSALILACQDFTPHKFQKEHHYLITSLCEGLNQTGEKE